MCATNATRRPVPIQDIYTPEPCLTTCATGIVAVFVGSVGGVVGYFGAVASCRSRGSRVDKMYCGLSGVGCGIIVATLTMGLMSLLDDARLGTGP